MAVAPITSIKGIGPRRAEAFGRLGLFSVAVVYAAGLY